MAPLVYLLPGRMLWERMRNELIRYDTGPSIEVWPLLRPRPVPLHLCGKVQQYIEELKSSN